MLSVSVCGSAPSLLGVFNRNASLVIIAVQHPLSELLFGEASIMPP